MTTNDTHTDTGDMGMYESEIHDVRAALRKSSTPCPNVDSEWRRFASRHATAEAPRHSRSFYLWRGVAIGVAATLLCLLALSPLLRDKSNDPVVVFEAVKQDSGVKMTSVRQPANKNGGAKPTVREGTETILLSQSEIDMRTVEIRDNTTEERTITTPRGKEMKIVLSDGTEVLLNADSRLRFPIRFIGGKREVVLEGEAYFTVAKDKKHPFIVKSGDVTTTALGTEFNVSSYDDKNTCVTLISGSVAVNNATERQRVVLNPGQDVSMIGGKLVVAAANPKVFTYWKEGFFYFDNVPLVDILTELGRWYNVTVELKSRSLMSYRLHFAADRNSPLSDAISRLNNFSYLKATINGNKVEVSMAVPTQKLTPAFRKPQER